MRPFYISKNRYGYYSVRFVNPETGLMTPYKSTHTADYSEALTLFNALSVRFGNTALYSTPVTTPIPAPTPVVEAAPSVSDLPKKAKVIVHRKNALADSGMIPQEIANKCYEALNPECNLNLCEFLKNFWDNEEYRMDMDVVGTFINDCFDIDATLKWRLPNQMLYQTYIKWCNVNNERIMSQKWLTMRMSEKGFKRMVSNNGRIWLGLARKPQWEK